MILTEEDIDAYPISIDSWDAEGIASDLESICAVPGRTNEFLVAESGNWQGKIGRVFHIQVDLDTHKGKVLSSFKYPLLDLNDFDAEGDQYEAIHCLAYSEKERVLILGERGGSEVNPEGILRWGIWNIEEQTFTMDDKGLKGVKVNAPGNWTNDATKRSITDLHVDVKGIIWASASEDQGDAGPFYSVIYKLGKVNLQDTQNPISVFDNLSIGKEIHGFKIEALSGAPKDVDCTHTFGTEDEIYGGVLRPVIIGR